MASTLTKLQRRFLSQRYCGLCEQPLHRNGCGAIYERCSQETIDKRRADCLKTYRPRQRSKP